MDQKLPLIVFSGGMDSSYMLWKQLEQGPVHTCYIKATQSQDKIEAELAVRKKIIAFFEKKTGNKVISDTIVDLGNAFVATRKYDPTEKWGRKESWNNNVPDHLFSQALVWPFALQFATDGNKHSKVCLGYVMGDQFAVHLGDMSLAWQHTSSFARKIFVPMEFPLVYQTKDRILEELPLEIIPDLWICELPESVNGVWTACDDCPACITMAKTVFAWEKCNKLNLQEQIASRLTVLSKPEIDDTFRKEHSFKMR